MDWSIFQNAFGLVVELGIPFIAAALIAALLVGAFQAATQITDEVIGFAGKLVAMGIALSLFGGTVSNQILEFTERIWSGADFYF